MEDLKRAHELRVDEFSEGKLIQNQNAFTGTRNMNCKMRSVVWMIEENLRMSNQYAVDNYLMFPVNLFYFFFLLTQGGMLSRVRNTQPDLWIRMVYRETFLSIPLHILCHHILKCSIQLMFLLRDIFRCKQARGNPQLKVVIEITTQSQLRDFYEVRQSEIHSTQMEEIILKNYGADQQRLQISELHFDNLPYSTNVFVLENKIQDWGMLLSKFPYGSDAMDQRSGGS